MTVKIDVKGPIISNDEAWIYDWFEMDATSRKISKELTNANGDDLIVSINSPVVMYTKGQKFIQH